MSELEMPIDTIPSPTLKRLLKEVAWEQENKVTAYNRTHNRHNRGGGGWGYPRPRPVVTPEPEED